VSPDAKQKGREFAKFLDSLSEEERRRIVLYVNLDMVGACIGSGIGGIPLIEETHNAMLAGGPRKIGPFFIPGTI